MKYQILQKYKEIWSKAFPYQDVRNDRGHAFVVTAYAQDICILENTNPDVVVLAAILHDVGWSKVAPDTRMSVFNYDAPKELKLKARYEHQEAGVLLAKEILNSLDYPQDLVSEILEIISEHDTRLGFISANEGAMRDADKLWRFDDYGFLNDNQNGGYSFETDLKELETKLNLENFFYFESSKERAKTMLGNLKIKYLD